MTDEQRIDKAVYLVKAVAHPLRLQILLLTKDEEFTVSALQNKLSVDYSLLSHHLINMRTKGILSSRRQGVNVLYGVADSAFVKALNVLLMSQVTTTSRVSETTETIPGRIVHASIQPVVT